MATDDRVPVQPAEAPGIEDYGLIGDCHTCALVSRWGSIDWCCLPRFDSPSCFGRLLDWERGGHWTIQPDLPGFEVSRRYEEETLILETRFRTDRGEARLWDCFAMRQGGREQPRRQLLRVVEGIAGEVPMLVVLEPRIDYGRLRPWMREHSPQLLSAVAGDTGLVVCGDIDFDEIRRGHAVARFVIRPGQRRHLSLELVPPQQLHPRVVHEPVSAAIEERLDETRDWWHDWLARRTGGKEGATPGVVRSAITLKALTYAPTGAIVAAATTSLPEAPGGVRNWDYRYCWIRDAVYSLRSLGQLGFECEAERFRWFVERTTAGTAEDLRVLYRVDGGLLLGELELPHLAGYRGAQPVRVENAAHDQFQLDCWGELLDLAWIGHQAGREWDEDYTRFLKDVVELVRSRWREPDHGLWESRAGKQQFAHSKLLSWLALDRGIKLMQALGVEAPLEAWGQARDEVRAALEEEAYDPERGVFVRILGGKSVDAAMLRFCWLGFLEPDDPRLVRTVDAVREELDAGGGLVRRYAEHDGLPGLEGAFVPACFWVAECLARQGRVEEAEEAFLRACATGNDLGLFAEEFQARAGTALGNFPQGMSHYAHLAACLALQRAGSPPERHGVHPGRPAPERAGR